MHPGPGQALRTQLRALPSLPSRYHRWVRLPPRLGCRRGFQLFPGYGMVALVSVRAWLLFTFLFTYLPTVGNPKGGGYGPAR